MHGPRQLACLVGRADTRAALLALAGTLLAFTAPLHRLDLLAYGVAAMLGGLVWRPGVGPFVIGATLPVFFFSRPLVGPLSFSPPGLLLVLAWLATLVQAARRRLTLRWPVTGYDAPLALFLAAGLVSLLVSEYLVLSARELRALVFEPVAFFWLLYVLGPRRAAPTALAGFLLAASLTAAVAIAELALGIGGTQAEGVRRAQAWYPQPNHLALMLGRALPFLLAAAVALRRPLMWVGVGLVGLAILLTFSTGGWLGASAAVVVVLLGLGWRRLGVRLGLAGAAGLVVVFSLAAAGLLPERLNPLRQTGGFRLDLWLSSLEMLRGHPLLGIGPDNFAYLYQQQYLREGAAAEPNLSHPHNWLLHFWLGLGLPGLVAFAWLLLRFWRAAKLAFPRPLVRSAPLARPVGVAERSEAGEGGVAADSQPSPLDKASPSGRGWIVAGAVGSMADLLVHGTIDNSYFLVDLAFVFWLSLALAAGD